MNDAPWASLLVRPLIILVVIAALVGLAVGLLVANFAPPQAQVATASQLNCEDELHRMFETREQCRQLKDLEDRYGVELAGGVK
jgi:Na+/H+-dicarboxylate symporter